VQNSFIEGFADLIREPLIHESLTAEEQNRAQALAETKFADTSWNYKRR